MATVTTAFFSAPDVLLTAPATLPTCSVRRTDTGAVVSSGNMVNLGGGLYSFTFATVDGLEYAAICDGDPIVAGQTFLGARYRDGAISGTTTERVEVDVPAILADTAAMQPTVAANLDAQVSLVETEAAALARATADITEHLQTQTDIAALNNLDQADVQAAMTAQGYTAARAPNLDNLDAAVSSRSSHDAADVDTQLSGTHGAGSWTTFGGTPSTIADAVWDEARAAHVAAGSFGEALDAQVSLAETEVAAAARAVTNQAEHDATQADVAALNDLSQADVQAALTAQGYTAARAPNLDQLDAAVSSRSSHSAADVDTQLSGTHGAGSWLTGAGASPGLIADAVWDEARAAHVAGGSFGEGLDARVSLVETEAAAAARAVTNQTEHDATQADVAALNDLSQADVQSAMTAQGYTAARALLLDNLDALVSSRSSHNPAAVDAQLSGTHGAGSWATAAGFAVPGDLMGLVAGAITSAKVAADAFTGTQFDATMQSYQGKVWNFDDDLAGTPADRYGVAFFKNGNFVTAGITSPTLRVVRTSDGVDLVAPVALVPVPGFPGLFGYEETSAPARMIDGVGYFALVSATLDAGTRTWPQQIGRDNTP